MREQEYGCAAIISLRIAEHLISVCLRHVKIAKRFIKPLPFGIENDNVFASFEVHIGNSMKAVTRHAWRKRS